MIPEEMSSSEFYSEFKRFNPTDTLMVDIGGTVRQPIRAFPASHSSTLVVLFHGAVNREKREYPTFLDFRSGIENVAHQISISDATLGLDPKLQIGWYAGSEEFPLQKLLSAFFSGLKKALGVKRVIFMGSSGGGFGALYYSSQLAGSAAVVQVPQTNVHKYHLPGAVTRFRSTCWPNRFDKDPVLDLKQVLKGCSDNVIVFIQSTLDFHHLHDQMIPFIASVPEEMRDRVIVKSSFWGRAGHSNVVPFREWEGWLKALLVSESWDAESIAFTYQSMGIEKTAKVGKSTIEANESAKSGDTSGKSPRNYSSQDLSWADIIAKEQLD